MKYVIEYKFLPHLWYSILGQNSGRAQDFYASASTRAALGWERVGSHLNMTSTKLHFSSFPSDCHFMLPLIQRFLSASAFEVPLSRLDVISICPLHDWARVAQFQFCTARTNPTSNIAQCDKSFVVKKKGIPHQCNSE